MPVIFNLAVCLINFNQSSNLLKVKHWHFYLVSVKCSFISIIQTEIETSQVFGYSQKCNRIPEAETGDLNLAASEVINDSRQSR